MHIYIYIYIYRHVPYYMLKKIEFQGLRWGGGPPQKTPKLSLEGGTRTQQIETEGKQAEQSK